ncbi:MAG: hypothetical protein RLY57_64 [Candidatus Parcubacteria bacterium]|jgi:hypothetical protein
MTYIIDLLNNNQGVVSVILFVLTILFAWATGVLKWVKSEISKNKRSKNIICAWRAYSKVPIENNSYIEYKFGPILQNKNNEIIRDFWINFSSSGFDLHLTETPQTTILKGWNIRNEALNLILKEGESLAPQNFLEPFIITIKLSKKLPEHSAWIYLSYGVSNSPKNTFNYVLNYSELKKFIDGSKHSTENFLEYIGATSSVFFKNKIVRIFWK